MNYARGDGDPDCEYKLLYNITVQIILLIISAADPDDLLTILHRWGAIIWRRIRNILSFHRRIQRRRWGLRVIDTIRNNPRELLSADINNIEEPRPNIASSRETIGTVQGSSNSATAGSDTPDVDDLYTTEDDIQYLYPDPSNLQDDMVEMTDDDSDEYAPPSSDTEDDDENPTRKDVTVSDSEQQPGTSGLYQNKELGFQVPSPSEVEAQLARDRRFRGQREKRMTRRRSSRLQFASQLASILRSPDTTSSTSQSVRPTEDQPRAESAGIEENASNVGDNVSTPALEESN